ncbi:MAG: Re/Si-specific NAD(P)(+) transhydrogenase subunit alpha [Bryobacterales bacterium]|nr:Re/Si-specific NAD(P)(+) transhydrogenase subunit alpha [Bryobacteraceae bacterium]MDW8355888.1 Re/Si-specific NAD(P)(+) transhydrogenase subunit alpha [Bryobacterales bacterium]
MTVGVPKETYPGERRVALVPAVVPSLRKAALDVLVESGAGLEAGFADSAYAEKGARIAGSREEVFEAADVIVQVRAYGSNPEAGGNDLRLLRASHTVIGFFDPLGAPERVRDAAGTGATLFALELMPRITRAQGMDALSSMATIAGYKAVILAAERLSKIFPMLMTAAGTLAPARVFVIGAGVAGLQAIATAKRLGGVVQAYDVRPSVKEQVQSVGAKFVELPLETAGAEDTGGYARAFDESFYRRQRELMARVVADSDVVISTAAVPGERAPILITEPMVASMAPGSVIVDLAAERGGNCELTRPGETVTVHGVSILGPLNLPATVPHHASQMYARNVATFLTHLIKNGTLTLDGDDAITRDTLIARHGQVVHPRVLEKLQVIVREN